MRVSIGTIDGTSTDLLVDEDCTVFQLRGKIEKELKIPAECQKLVAGSTILPDTTDEMENIVPLRELRDGDDCVCITVLVSVEHICDQIAFWRQNRGKHPDAANAQRHYLGLLRKLQCRGNDRVVEEVIACMRCQYSIDVEVLLETVETFSSIAGEGNENAIAVMVDLAKHGTDDVRRAALKVLPDVAGKSHKKATLSIMGCLVQPRINGYGCILDEGIREAALEALLKMVDSKDDSSMASVAAHMKAQSERIRSMYSYPLSPKPSPYSSSTMYSSSTSVLEPSYTLAPSQAGGKLFRMVLAQNWNQPAMDQLAMNQQAMDQLALRLVGTAAFNQI